MKYFLLPLLLIPATGMSAVIPVEKFDQSKLESMLRRIPSAFVEAREENGVNRKTYLYPTQGPLRILCVADYFEGADIPTYKSCKLTVETGRIEGLISEKQGDEYRLIITHPIWVQELYKSISFGTNVKISNSHEQVYGKSFEGISKNIFRYGFSCSAKACTVTMTAKPSPN